MSHDRVVGGHPKPHIWNQRPKFAYSLYNFYGATTTIKGSLDRVWSGSTSIVGRKFCPVKIGPKNGGFWELRGVNVKFLFSNPEKAHPCAEARRLTYYAWKSVQASRLQERKKRNRVNIFMRKFAHTGKRNPWRDRDYILPVGRSVLGSNMLHVTLLQ